ncbi:MAG: PqqD family protein [Bdellovibrio sp.]|nr:PqqD family protein [Bdellovibrio sp.]
MSKINYLNISTGGIAFDPKTGESFQLNESAALIISLMQKGMSTEEIAKRLAKQFKLTYEHALTEVMEFEVQLEVIGIAA